MTSKTAYILTDDAKDVEKNEELARVTINLNALPNKLIPAYITRVLEKYPNFENEFKTTGRSYNKIRVYPSYQDALEGKSTDGYDGTTNITLKEIIPETADNVCLYFYNEQAPA